MAHFMKDQVITNTTITAADIKQLENIFISQLNLLNEGRSDEQDPKRVVYWNVVRFDNKGYRVFSYDALIEYFSQAHYVERIVFILESAESIRSNRNTGTVLELRLDDKEPNNSYLMATSDDNEWVNSAFSAIQEVLGHCKNRNGLIRNGWTNLLIQVTGVILGFGLSLWGASIIAPYLNIESPFAISFIFVLLIFSNIWTYLNQSILKSIDRLFPNMKFYRPAKNRGHWLMQAVVGGLTVTLALYFLSKLFSYIGKTLGSFIGSS